MTRLQETLEISRPIDEVFQYTANFANIEQWDPGVTESAKLSPGPVGVGTEFRVVVKSGLGTMPMHYVVTTCEPPTRIVLEGRGGAIHAIDDIQFATTTTGTRIAYTADITFSGWMGLVEPFLQGMLDRIGKNAIAGLRVALTEEPPAPTAPGLINSIADRLILPGMLGFTHLGYRWRKRSWKPLSASLAGKTAVVTGATSGLGRITAERLAELGARVILIGRNVEKTEQARREISANTGNAVVVAQIADLSLLSEVRRLADRLLQDEPQIHLLINNAGVLLNTRTTTAEGIETTLATNLLAPFLLTNRLIPRLVASAPARIINVSSGGMYTTAIAADDLQYDKGVYDGSRAYARTKRALVILSEQWAERLRDRGVVVHAMHPGWADTPGVETSLPTFYRLTKRFLRTPAEGGDTIVWLAAAPEAGRVSGLFWLDREPHITDVLPGTQASPEQRRQLWDALSRLSDWQESEETR
jgi:NAD(P)-dependent dehydrogenase (short-subunit alcohol dehydrogenase family)/carbon monoxide dehydrogenase subunit G